MREDRLKWLKKNVDVGKPIDLKDVARRMRRDGLYSEKTKISTIVATLERSSEFATIEQPVDLEIVEPLTQVLTESEKVDAISGRMIDAIKSVRARTGLGLVLAKNTVEVWRDSPEAAKMREAKDGPKKIIVTLPPYDVNNSCPKCLFPAHHMGRLEQKVTAKNDATFVPPNKKRVVIDGLVVQEPCSYERIVRKCHVCRHTWEEGCLDGKRDSAGRVIVAEIAQ